MNKEEEHIEGKQAKKQEHLIKERGRGKVKGNKQKEYQV